MNKVILSGRLTKDPEVRYTQGANTMAVARYTLAVDRRFKKEGEASADFINCVAFGKTGEFAEKYFRKGTKIAIVGRLQTGSYTNKDGQKVYTTDVVLDDIEFAESKGNQSDSSRPEPSSVGDGFMQIPDGYDENLPFAEEVTMEDEEYKLYKKMRYAVMGPQTTKFIPIEWLMDWEKTRLRVNPNAKPQDLLKFENVQLRG